MVDQKRIDIIKYGVENGYGPNAVNKALAKNGYGPLTMVEKQRVRENIPLDSNVFQRLGADAKAIASGIPTLGGMAIKYATDPGYRTQLNRQVSTEVKKQGIGNVSKNIADVLLEPSNLSVGNFGKNPVDFVNRLASGAVNHPGYFLLNVGLPATGVAKTAGLLPKGNIIGNVLEKADIPGTRTLQKFIPSDNLSKVNVAINQSRNRLNAKYQEPLGELNIALAAPGDSIQANRNLMGLKPWAGDEATIAKTKSLQKIYELYNKELAERYSLKPEVAKENVIAQGIVEELNPLRNNPNIYYGSVDAALKGDKNALELLGIGQNKLNELRTLAEKKYARGEISPISYRYNYETALGQDRGRFSMYDNGNTGPAANRVWGMGTVEQLTDTIPEAYRELSNRLVQGKTGEVSLRSVAEDLGRKVTNNKDLGPNEVVVSPRAFEEKLKQDFANGAADIGSAMERIATGLGPDAIKKYADDLYAIDRRYLEPLVNMTTVSRVPNFMGPLDSWWKQVALSEPSYVATNRMGNWSLMATAGVTPFDIADAYRLRRLAPKALQSETSFAGILGQEWGGKGIKEYGSKAINEMKSGMMNKDWIKTIGGVNRLFASPFLPTESKLETIDRLAVLIHEGKKMFPGKTSEELIDLMNKDNKVFSTLNDKVKNVLGDYAGRNWAIPNNFYSPASKLVPFSKYPLQSGRVLFHQAMWNPIGYQAGFNIPSRLGNNLWERQKRNTGRGDKEFGGVFYGKKMNKKFPINFARWNAHPFTANLEMLYNVGGNPGGIRLSPLIDLAKYSQFKDAYGNTASDPRYLNVNNSTLILDDNGNVTNRLLEQPSFLDVARYTGAGLANQFLTPVQQMNRFYLPLIGTDPRTGGYYPRYDTSLFGQIGDKSNTSHIFSGKTRQRGKTGVEAFLAPALGFQFRQVYPDYNKADKRTMTMGRKKIIRMKQQKGNK